MNAERRMAPRMIVQGIITKYLPVTNHRGSRIKAAAAAGSITVPYDHALNIENNHYAAAEALANKFGWLANGWELVQGGSPDGSGYVFVQIPRQS